MLGSQLSSAALRSRMKVRVSLVLPVLNEEETIGLFLARIDAMVADNSGIIVDFVFVNDGSTDRTLDVLLGHQEQGRPFQIIDLSRNFGKEAALSAGLQAARGDVVVPIDVDLQHPPELIVEMLEKWREGYDVVLARSNDRSSDTPAKRISARLFYALHNRVSDTPIPADVGDFRLMDQCVIKALNQLPETRRFMKGLFAWVGFRTTVVEYVRAERSAGESKFNGWKLWNFAVEGLTSFSTAPLRIWTYIGGTVAFLALVYGAFILLRSLILGTDTPGFASIFVAVSFLGGLQLIGIGVLGEYLGRTFLEAKRRPPFLVRHIYEQDPSGRTEVVEAEPTEQTETG